MALDPEPGCAGAKHVGPLVVMGGVAASYERGTGVVALSYGRGTPVNPEPESPGAEHIRAQGPVIHGRVDPGLPTPSTLGTLNPIHYKFSAPHSKP